MPEGEPGSEEQLPARIDQLQIRKNKLEDQLIEKLNPDQTHPDDWLIATGLTYYPDRRQATLNDPDIALFVRANTDLVDSMLQIQSDLNNLRRELISDLIEQRKAIEREMLDHFDWDGFFDPDASSTIVVTGCLTLEDLSDFRGRDPGDIAVIDPDELELLDHHERYRYSRIQTTLENMKEAGLYAEGKTDYHHHLENIDLGTASAMLASSEKLESGINFVNEVNRFIYPAGRAPYFVGEAITTWAGRITDEAGIPVGLAGNETLIKLAARRVQVEVEKSKVSTFFPETSPNPEKVEESLKRIKAFVEETGDWIRLSNKYRGTSKTTELSQKVIFMGLAHYFSQTGELPEIITQNPSVAVRVARLIELNTEKLRKRGVVRRINPGHTYPHEQCTGGYFEGKIEGLEIKDGLVLVLDKKALWERISNTMPIFFTEGIPSIRFIESSDFPPFEYRIDEIDQALKNVISVDIVGTINHEIFENVVEKLNLDQMEAWEEALAKDRQEGKVEYVTAYSRVSSFRDPALGDKEDLCETAKLYFDMPQQLRLIAPHRHEFIVNLIASYLTPPLDNDYRARNLADYKLDPIVEKTVTKTMRAHEQTPRAELENAKWIDAGGFVSNVSTEKPAETEIEYQRNEIIVSRSPYIKIKSQ